MRLINTTSSHPELVRNQLENTDAKLVEVYSAGNTDVVFTKAPKHYELLISNKYRAIKDEELEAIREFFLKRKIDQSIIIQEQMKSLHTAKLIEISYPTTA
ncbi:Ribose 5-phosphate isomerase [Streptococcus agalactiae]|nr:Ribose 5-phosphate isomerase [Streptococcus agalactiae]